MKTRIAGLIFLFVFSTQITVLASNSSVSVNEKTLKAFRDAYPHAEKVVWKENEEYYFVYFRDNGIFSQIDYDHDGNFQCSLRYYNDANLLPPQLALELQKKYPAKTVYGITETSSQSNNTTFFIKLEDAHSWTSVKGTADGYIRVMEKLNKQQ